jgi:non-ribosomal peptide synthetase component E (peptide arylation enzyme)
MANINALSPSEDLAAAAFTATASGGDKIIVTDPSKSLLIEFLNNHSGAVTAIVTPEVTSGNDAQLGLVTKAAESLSVAQNGGTAVMRIPASLLSVWMDPADNSIALTYTSHNVALLVRALQA